jgi:hypothetical protein
VIDPDTLLPVTRTAWLVTRTPDEDYEFVPVLVGGDLVLVTGKREAGEPTMEKIVAFRQVLYGDPNWSDVTLYAGYWVTGCANFYYRTRTYRTPVGCAWRYQY